LCVTKGKNGMSTTELSVHGKLNVTAIFSEQEQQSNES